MSLHDFDERVKFFDCRSRLDEPLFRSEGTMVSVHAHMHKQILLLFAWWRDLRVWLSRS